MDLGKDFCLFVCLFLRDSSQAQKLCSFLAGGFEPEPFLGSDSTLLYSFDSLKSRLQLGEGRQVGAAPARGRQELEGATRPPLSLSLQRGVGSLAPGTHSAIPSRQSCWIIQPRQVLSDVWKRSQRESTQLYTDYMGFREVPVMSHAPGSRWGRPAATRQVPSTHWQRAGYLHTCPD